MRRSIMTIAALALLTTAAQAASKPHTFYKGKYWETYGMSRNDDGVPMCGMETKGDNNLFYIKWSPTIGMTVQIWKSTWQIAEDTKVAFGLDFFNDTRGERHSLTTETGWAKPMKGVGGSAVFMSVNSQDAPDVIAQFAAADKIVISFPKGDEPAWGVRMEGSSKAANEFLHCMEMVTSANKRPTSPVAPTQPVTTPVPAKPDGSI